MALWSRYVSPVRIIVGVLLAYFGTHLSVWRPLTPSGLLILYLMVGLGLAAGLLGKKPGDKVQVQLPSGSISIEVLATEPHPLGD